MGVVDAILTWSSVFSSLERPAHVLSRDRAREFYVVLNFLLELIFWYCVPGASEKNEFVWAEVFDSYAIYSGGEYCNFLVLNCPFEWLYLDWGRQYVYESGRSVSRLGVTADCRVSWFRLGSYNSGFFPTRSCVGHYVDHTYKIARKFEFIAEKFEQVACFTCWKKRPNSIYNSTAYDFTSILWGEFSENWSIGYMQCSQGRNDSSAGDHSCIRAPKWVGNTGAKHCFKMSEKFGIIFRLFIYWTSPL